MYGAIPGIILGLAAIILGARGFTPAGLPFGRFRGLKGGPEKVIGLVLIVLGLGFLALSIWSLLAASRG